MINEQLLNPKSIVVVGGSNNVHKPGGKVLKNLLDGGYKGRLYATNLNEDIVQGIKCYRNIEDLPSIDLAIIAIEARLCPDIVETLSKHCNVRSFIILSAGFSETDSIGKEIEDKVVSIINSVNGSLIGPNCIGVLTPVYHGVFTEPIPKLSAKGCDFISASGAAACFIMESAMLNGLTFANVFSVGNSAQNGVEDILQHLDETFDPAKSSFAKLLYIESVNKPRKLLKHAASLIRKGCKIAAIKAGVSESGSRAAMSHTAAIVNPDVAVDALFRKAGITRCYSRQELATTGAIFMHPQLKCKNIAVITHAGGPGVMLADALSKDGFDIPRIDNEDSNILLKQLHPGSAVNNPIDFLATGTADQLKTIIDCVENKFSDIDGMAIIFGSPGLVDVFDVYDALHEKMQTTKKPVFPILPSIITAKREVESFLAKGHINFQDEVVFAGALAKVYYTPKPSSENIDLPNIDRTKIRKVIDGSEDGYIPPDKVQNLLDAVGVNRVNEEIVFNKESLVKAARKIGYPLAMKAVGPIHKSDVGGVVLNITADDQMQAEFDRMMSFDGVTGVLLQPMLLGIELFVGAKLEERFGRLILCGLGGSFVEELKDVKATLAPTGKQECLDMIHSLKSQKILAGARGQAGVNKDKFADIMVKISALIDAAPEITELDLNPIIAHKDEVVVVDARIKITAFAKPL